MGTRAELRQLVRMLDLTGVRPAIAQVLPLAQARQGFEAMVAGDVLGKIVFTA
jgi:D-arabinose 1-dehydrogenase-like Zn-dependent alcohol dehydrogenase